MAAPPPDSVVRYYHISVSWEPSEHCGFTQKKNFDNTNGDDEEDKASSFSFPTVQSQSQISPPTRLLIRL